MASQPLLSWSEPALALPAPRLVAVNDGPTFSRLEWSIVGMAGGDGLSSLRTRSRFWTLVGALFGIKPANHLANERLEALRRVAVLAWAYRWNVPESELRAFYDAGYSPAHYEKLQAKIASIRSAKARRTVR